MQFEGSKRNFIFLVFKSGKYLYSNIPFFLICFAILSPPIRFKLIPPVRLELILIIFAWILFILAKFAKGEKIKVKITPVHKWFFIFGVSFFLSVLWAFIIKGFLPIPRDFFEIIKLLKYFLIFAFVTNIDNDKINFKNYYFFTIYMFLISASVGLIQYFDLFHNFNESYIRYLNPAQFDGMIYGKRIVGTTGNPNDFGFLMVLASLFSLVGILWIRNVKSIFISVFLIVFVFCIVLTLSRTALICLIVGILFVIFWKYPKKVKLKTWSKTLLLFIPIIAIFIIVIYFFAPQQFFLRIRSAINVKTESSVQIRLQIWKRELDIWKQSPLFGWGPGKTQMTRIVDSEWVLILRRYGLIGLVIFVLWLLSFYRGIVKIQKSIQNGMFLEIFSVSTQVSFIVMPVYMITLYVYHNLQITSILMIFLGLCYSQYNKILKGNNSKL